MPKNTSRKMPRRAEIVRTYEDFYSEIDAFEYGERGLLIIVGPPGTSKSTAVRNFLKNARVIEGGSTLYRLYQELYENRDLPIVNADREVVLPQI